MNNAQSVSLNRMQINDHPNFGIRGFNVNGFDLANSTVNSVASGTSKNGTDAATDEGSIYFGAENPSGINGLVGTVNITNCLIEEGFENNFKIASLSGTLSQFTMTGTTIRDNSTASPATTASSSGWTARPTSPRTSRLRLSRATAPTAYRFPPPEQQRDG